MERLQPTLEIIKGEGLKSVAELALAGLSSFRLGERLIESYGSDGRGRVEDPALHTSIAGIDFENPIMVGAGWDKKGRAIHGLYALGFSGVEVGTVPLFGQPGNPKPRMWTINRAHSVGLNRLGFNSPGAEAVEVNLNRRAPFDCPVGINVGKNKLMPDDRSPWAHSEVVRKLYPYADYFVFNPSSPNTPGLRDLQQQGPMREHIHAMQSAMDEEGGRKPLFVKLAPDLAMNEFDDAVAVSVEEGVDGLVLVNTTISEGVKDMYGLRGEMGGVSGNNAVYRVVALYMTAHAYEIAGDKLEIVGVGAISHYHHAIERMIAGASLLQVVTGIREHNGRVANQINRGILGWMQEHKAKNIKELIGVGTKRGGK